VLRERLLYIINKMSPLKVNFSKAKLGCVL
jgi:hypothetical protein